MLGLKSLLEISKMMTMINVAMMKNGNDGDDDDMIAMMTIFVSINRPVDRGSYCSPTVRFVVTLLGEVRPGGDKMTVRLLMIIIIVALLPTSS